MKPHVLFIGEAVTLTHVLRPKMLADALHAAGYPVTLACDPRFDALMGERPYRTIPLRSSIDAATNAQILKRNEPLFSPRTLADYVREDTRLMRLLAPRLVVGDMRQSLSISARRLGVPYVNIINAHWSPFSDVPLEVVHNPWTGLLGREAAERVARALTPVGSMLVGLPHNIARVSHGLPPVGLTLKEVFTDGDYVVHPDIPEINPTRDPPPQHRHIGPIQWTPSRPVPPWWGQVPADRPLVYLNLGSSGEPSLLAGIVAALVDLPVSVMVGTTDKGAVASSAGNLFVADFIPGEEAARRAALVVCNGGASTAYQALAGGAPFLAIPSNADQLVFTRLAVQLGVAECLLEAEAGTEAVRDAAMRMLDGPQYKANAERLARALAGYDAPARFVSFIEEILGGTAALSAGAPAGAP